ncbi:MAG: transglycosylase domain-containing protein [Clostridia bacterium]|nr:transglycosylase domain-containing protein [Clostridia bacterium]
MKNNQKNKKYIVKTVIILIIFSIILATFSYYNSLKKWKATALQMINNENYILLEDNIKNDNSKNSKKHIEKISLNDLPPNLVNAYIAIEDERYYKHFGIDIKRTSAAIGSYIIHFGHASFGGSTITQQLVKNLTGENSNTISRKVKEWIKAIQLETFLSKEEILETYFNIIYTGPNIYGVSEASKYYFNKNVKDLNLVECAFLAGINISPNSFNPFGKEDNAEKITNRIKTVLYKMEELNYITEEEYNNSLIEYENINFKKSEF